MKLKQLIEKIKNALPKREVKQLEYRILYSPYTPIARRTIKQDIQEVRGVVITPTPYPSPFDYISVARADAFSTESDNRASIEESSTSYSSDSSSSSYDSSDSSSSDAGGGGAGGDW